MEASAGNSDPSSCGLDSGFSLVHRLRRDGCQEVLHVVTVHIHRAVRWPADDCPRWEPSRDAAGVLRRRCVRDGVAPQTRLC